jgi:hypothetical protein
MALQLSTRQFHGSKGIDDGLDPSEVKRFRDLCSDDKNCVMQGKTFTLFKSGLFDVLSDYKPSRQPSKKVDAIGSGLASVLEISLARSRPSPIDFGSSASGVNLKDGGDGTCSSQSQTSNCFGACGPGCATPGNSYTPECRGHDYCVCSYGHLDCMFSTPDGCGAPGIPCSTLLDAVWSWLEDMLDNDGGTWDEEECGFFGCSLG